MTLRRLLASFSILVLSLVGTVAPATAQQAPPPSQRFSNVSPTSDVALQQMPGVDEEALQREDANRRGEIGPYRYGRSLQTNFSPDEDGTWERLPSGNWLWRLRIQSQDAVSLSLGFIPFRIPKGAELYLRDPAGETIRGPYTRNDATQGQHWTPLIRGDEIIVELEVPRTRRQDVHLRIGRVVHGYRSFTRASSRESSTAKAGTCNIDVACPEADSWREQVRAVGLYHFESGNNVYSCTGSLINNTNQDATPYFLTAEHCISTAEEAVTMTFYWNYQHPSCRTPGTEENGQETSDDKLDQTSSGALLRARYGNWHVDQSISGKADLSLVEIDDTFPPDYDLYLSGWSREGTGTSRAATVHHPQGHGKRISFDEDASTISAYAEDGNGETHLKIGNWDTGTTEQGSSGSPLLNTDERIVAVLSGGLAGCVSGTAEDNDEPDWYGRLAYGYTAGDYQDATFADYLDPTNSGVMTLDGRPQLDADDDTPPSTVDDLAVDSTGATSMVLTWTAPGDDGDQGSALLYELRYDTSPIDSETDFSTAKKVSTVSRPKKAGSAEQTTVDGLIPDSSYYFGVKAVDDGNNESGLGTTGPKLLEDIVPPAKIENFAIERVNTSELAVTLTWTATGDDWNQRAASEYDIRYAHSPIETQSDFENATPVDDLPAPAPPGTEETVTLDTDDGLEQDESYYFAVVAVDNRNNRSSYTTSSREAVLTKDIEVRPGGVASQVNGSFAETGFVLNESQEVQVSLYDLLGRRVRVIFRQAVEEGFQQTVRTETTDLSSGTYFLRFEGETFTTSRKLVIVK